jgi:RimJ/RimL family protein N-acetyltransferase
MDDCAPRDSEPLVLRRATIDDAARLFAWRNNVVTRQYARSSEPVDFAEHMNWLAGKLADTASALWVGEVRGVPVAQVRVDIDGGTALLDYAVAPSARRQGLGTAVLRALQREVMLCPADSRPAGILAQVKTDNIASLRALRSSGWVADGEPVGGFVNLWWMP